MVQAFIFDIDGTLVDTAQIHIDSWARAFKESGIDIPADKIRLQLGRRASEIVQSLVLGISEDNITHIVERKRTIFREYYPLIKPFPMVKELFALLSKKGMKLALATSTTRYDAEFYVEILSIKGLLGAVITAEDIQNSKPHPEIFLKAAEQLGVEPRESVVVGDSFHDIEAAKSAGMVAIGVLTGGYSAEGLMAAGADKIYRDIKDLYNHIGEVINYCRF